MKIVSSLLHISIKVDSITNKKEVFYKCLVFDQNRNDNKLLNKTRVLLFILKNRMVRTLLTASSPLSESTDFFNITRFRILFILLKRRKIVSKYVLSKYSLEFLSFPDYKSLRKLRVSYQQSVLYIKSFQSSQKFLVEKQYSSRFQFKVYNSTGPYYPKLESFLQWNSTIFREFIYAHNLQDSIREIMRLKYPLIYLDFFRYQSSEFKTCSYSEWKLDDVYERFGLDTYETIFDVQIWHQRFIYSKDSFIDFDITASPRQKFVAGISSFINPGVYPNNYFPVELPLGRQVDLKEGIFLCGRADENWYHFLLDTLPRLLFFDSIPQEVPLLIRSDIPSTSKELLKRITSRRVVEIEPEEVLQVKKLYFRPGRSSVFDSRQPELFERVDYPSKIFKILRSKILAAFELELPPKYLNVMALHRTSTFRNVVNQRTIYNALHKLGIPIHSLSEDFFKNQVEFFFGSKLVITPGGAVLANILFMTPKSTVVVLHSSRSAKLGLWSKLAEACDLEFLDVRGFSTYHGFNHQRRLHSSFYVSPRKLRRILLREI